MKRCWAQVKKKRKTKKKISQVLYLKKKNVGHPLGGMWDVQENGCTH